jgi:hypothetical protein
MTQQQQMEIDSQSTHLYERLLIAGLCVTAAVRIFIFSAAFPFFNIISDEQSHFDMVYKYSRGHLPQSPLEKFDPISCKIISDNGSPELSWDPLSTQAVWDTNRITSRCLTWDNNETWAWPSYYVLAGLWCRVGEVIGLSGKNLLYWIRFLNAPIGALFVWLSWLLSRKLFESEFQKRVAIPLLAAFFPQDIFYCITNDVLSPLVFAAAFIMLLEIYLVDKSCIFYFFTGLIAAVTVLTKTTNIIIVVLALVVFCIKLKRAFNQKQLKRYFVCLAAFTVPFVVPVAFWLGRNYVLFGDVIGSSAAVKMLTWTKKPFGEMFNHPILTPRGIISFLVTLLEHFWRGEFTWGGKLKPMSWHPMDLFYVISSLLFLFACLLDVFIYKPKMSKGERSTLVWSLFVFITSVLLLAALSMRFDFGRCNNPSPAFPYFVSGRLIAGTILPFLLIYVYVLNRILTNLGLASYLLVAVAVIVIAVTASEIFITLPAFASPNNWFHIGIPRPFYYL